jgi:DNA-binding transcriptional ArsR family regulator
MIFCDIARAMEETIVQVARALACRTRLRILSLLAAAGELSPSDLRGQLGMSLPSVCAHLRRLSAAGLIRRRPAGPWCYALARGSGAPSSFAASVARGVYRSLSSGARRCRARLAPGPPASRPIAEPGARLHRPMFEAATAFANLRRVEMLRFLARQGPATGAALAARLRMSRTSLRRHAGKLVRRRYVAARDTGSGRFYALARSHKTRIHAQLWSLLSARWRKR